MSSYRCFHVVGRVMWTVKFKEGKYLHGHVEATIARLGEGM